jgi:hypothetical protein
MRYLLLFLIYIVCIAALVASDMVLHWTGWKTILVCAISILIVIPSTYKLGLRR